MGGRSGTYQRNVTYATLYITFLPLHITVDVYCLLSMCYALQWQPTAMMMTTMRSLCALRQSVHERVVVVSRVLWSRTPLLASFFSLFAMEPWSHVFVVGFCMERICWWALLSGRPLSRCMRKNQFHAKITAERKHVCSETSNSFEQALLLPTTNVCNALSPLLVLRLNFKEWKVVRKVV